MQLKLEINYHKLVNSQIYQVVEGIWGVKESVKWIGNSQ